MTARRTAAERWRALSPKERDLVIVVLDDETYNTEARVRTGWDVSGDEGGFIKALRIGMLALRALARRPR